MFRSDNQHFGQRGFHREIRHLLSGRSEFSDIIESPKYPELEHGVEDIFLRWGVHEVEFEEIFDAEGFEEEYGVCQICSLDFGNIVGEQLVQVGHLREQSVTESMRISSVSWPSNFRSHLPRSGPTGSTCPLTGIGLTDWSDLQGIHTDLRIVHLELGEPSVHDIQDTID